MKGNPMNFDCYTQELELAYQDSLFDVVHQLTDSEMDIPAELMPLTLGRNAARLSGISADYL
jgi:hypothetical protein